MNGDDENKNAPTLEDAKQTGIAITAVVLLFLVFVVWAAYQGAVNLAPAEKRAELIEPPEPIVRLPLSVHIARNVEVVYRGTPLGVWATREQIEKRVVPEINRIWRPAGIEWVLRDLREIDREMPEARELGAALAVNFVNPDSGPGRILGSYLQASGAGASDYHLVVVPLAGQDITGQAFALANVGTVAVWWLVRPRRGGTIWADKMRLAEPQRYRQGSVARTAAHELGHLLGLDHLGCAKYCLMAGVSRGHGLSQEEIAAARSNARRNSWRLRD